MIKSDENFVYASYNQIASKNGKNAILASFKLFSTNPKIGSIFVPSEKDAIKTKETLPNLDAALRCKVTKIPDLIDFNGACNYFEIVREISQKSYLYLAELSTTNPKNNLGYIKLNFYCNLQRADQQVFVRCIVHPWDHAKSLWI